MASFSNDYYNNGGLNFEASLSEQARQNRTAQPLYDDYDRSRQPMQNNRPRRPEHQTYADGFDDGMGDYIPGSTVSSVRSHYAAKAPVSNSFNDGFDDDFDSGFDDDFDTPAPPHRGAQPRQQAQPQRQRGMGYGVYDDYGADAFESEYGGLPTIGRRRNKGEEQPQPQRRPNVRPAFDDEQMPVSDDGYYSGATMVDQPFNGQVPSIFAGYFDPEYMMAMQQQQSRNRKNKVSSYEQRRKRRITTSIASALAIALVAGALTIYFAVFHISSPLNVTTAFSEMSATTSQSLIKQSVDNALDQQSLLVSVGGRTASFQLSKYDFEYVNEGDGNIEYIDVKDKDGNDVKQTIATKGNLRYNETLVREFLYDVVGSEGVRMVEPSFDVDYKTSVMVVKAGTNGYGIDYDNFMQQLQQHLSTSDFSTIECTMAETVAPAVDIDTIYENVHCLVSDAVKSYDSAGQPVYTPDVVGVDFDVNAARAQIAAGGVEWNINLVLTQPKLTLVELKAPECPDLLATYYTEFNADNKGRVNNLALAAKYITDNGYLEPGEVISFNDSVGERTQERGFCKATVYSSEGTDEDYGGGICQTSSTLYYTAVLANLEIVERRNHLYTVAYMTNLDRVQTFANDATVNWGTIDLKIKNDREYPIRIEFVCTTGKITCNIYGTWNGITADLKYAENAHERYKVIYRPAAPGKNNTAGQLGRTIQSYRVVYENGEEISREREALSQYIPLNEIRYTNSLPAGREYYIEY